MNHEGGGLKFGSFCFVSRNDDLRLSFDLKFILVFSKHRGKTVPTMN